MSVTLSAEGEKILRYLIAKLPSVNTTDLTTFPSYLQIIDALGFERNVGPTYGIALDTQGLANLAYWTIDRSFPAITGLVVDKQSQMPGQGFFNVYGRDPMMDGAWWLSEVERSKSFDWQSFL